MKTYGFDLIDLETARYGLIEVAREMFDALVRSSFSPIARDVRDCTAAVHLRTDEGWQMVSSWEGCVQHAFTSQHICNFVMAEWDESTFREGDVILMNDPWRGAIHCADLNVLRPVFVDGKVQFMLHSTAHVADLGGPIPGGFANGTRTMFEEQLKFPPVLLYAGGVAVRPTFNHLLENNRVPHLMLGDVRALAGSLTVGAKRLQEILDRGSFAKVSAGAHYAMDLAEAGMRKGIASIPDGDYSVTDILDDDAIVNEAIELKMTLKVRGDSMEIDYSGTSRQPAGNVGSPWIESTRAIIGAKFLLDPLSPVNSGTLRPFEALLPVGSAVCVLPPHSCSTHTEIGGRVVNMMTQALSLAIDDRSIACDCGTGGFVVMGGIDTRAGHEGMPWSTFSLPGGGWGGTWKGDGVSSSIVSIGSNCRSSVHEHVERESPLVVWEHQFVPDSAGAGKFRGGAGAVYTIGAISTAVMTITGDRSRAGAPGSHGGGTGMPFYGWVLRGNKKGQPTLDPRDFKEVTPLFGMFDESGAPNPDHGKFGQGTMFATNKIAQLVLQPGDGLRLLVGGGGGWGDPLERDPGLVLRDVEDRLHSPRFAREAYGVVVENGAVDEAATTALRKELATRRQAGSWKVPSACPPEWTHMNVMEVQ